MSSENEQNDSLIALIIGLILTFIFVEFFLKSYLTVVGYSFDWWIYIPIFLIFTGSIGNHLVKQRALRNLAYGAHDKEVVPKVTTQSKESAKDNSFMNLILKVVQKQPSAGTRNLILVSITVFLAAVILWGVVMIYFRPQ